MLREIDPLAFGPQRFARGGRRSAEQARGRGAKLRRGLAVKQGAAETVAIDRRLPRETIGRGGDGFSLRIDPGLEVAERLVARAGEILGLDGRRSAARDEHAAAQNLGAEARTDQRGAIEPRPLPDRQGGEGGEGQRREPKPNLASRALAHGRSSR